MNKKIFFLISIISYTIFIESAALIPYAVRSHAANFAKKTSKSLLGEQSTEKLVQNSKRGKDWINWYLRSISNPTPHELIQNSLFYSIESGTKESITGESSYKAIKKLCQSY